MTDAEINAAIMQILDPEGLTDYTNDYANSLDAIVPVVRQWCEKHDGDFDIQWHGGDRHSYSAIVWGDKEPPHQQAGDDSNPARALCLVFLQVMKETL